MAQKLLYLQYDLFLSYVLHCYCSDYSLYLSILVSIIFLQVFGHFRFFAWFVAFVQPDIDIELQLE